MTPYRRNIVVGATMLGAMIILGWMILQFGERPAKLFAPPTMPITIIAERADGISEGSIISYRGVGVGRIGTMKRSQDQLSVQIEAQIDLRPPPLPENLEGIIRSQVLGGSGSLSLQLIDPEPRGQLQAGAKLRAKFVGIEFLPPEFAELATELRTTTKQFRDSNLITHLDAQVAKAGEILDSIDKLVSDPQLREDVHNAVGNIRAASESAKRLGVTLEETTEHANQTLAKADTSIDSISNKTNDRMEQIARTLAHLESITAKIDQGKGTAGALVNDPKLYQSLVETSRDLNATIADLKRLVEQWEQEGVSLRVK